MCYRDAFHSSARSVTCGGVSRDRVVAPVLVVTWAIDVSAIVLWCGTWTRMVTVGVQVYRPERLLNYL